MAWLPKKCVVVPIDFSPATDNAVRTALSIVDDPRHVHVIHVATVPEIVPYGEFAWVVEPTEWHRKAALHLAQHIAANPEFRNVSSATLSGDPETGITQYAKDHAADLIVMPCHGYRGVMRLLMGSVTHRVLQHAPCEVLVQRFTD